MLLAFPRSDFRTLEPGPKGLTMAEEKEAGKMSATWVYNLIGFFGIALAVLFFILPPDKPKCCPLCPGEK